LRIKGTVIGARQNNPLKLAPTPESALRQLVGETEPGYMKPDAALREAIEDLKAHQMAMLAGMQRAIASLLERFEPEKLKQQLDHQPMLASILPGARKASYWTAYEALYRKIATEAAEDFNAVFGREFARAYEDQADRMRAEGDAARRNGDRQA
jgi:FHA domain-containing protein